MSGWCKQISQERAFSETVADVTGANPGPLEKGAGKGGRSSWPGALLTIYPHESKSEEDSRPSRQDRISVRKRR